MPIKTLESILKEKSVLLLVIFNGILLVASWVMSLVAYPYLPPEFPLLIDFLGRPLLIIGKSPVFFLSPLIQSALLTLCFQVSRRVTQNMEEGRRAQVIKEAFFLIFIFVQLVFIHVQRTLIYLAHGVERGFNPVYFYALFVIILFLVPYFRLRLKLIEKP